MRHIDIALTINTYTDARLLDTAEAVEALPSLPLDGAIGAPRTDAPMDAPKLGKESHIESHPDHSGDCGDDTQGTRKRRESLGFTTFDAVGATRFELATSTSRT